MTANRAIERIRMINKYNSDITVLLAEETYADKFTRIPTARYSPKIAILVAMPYRRTVSPIVTTFTSISPDIASYYW